ncbi:MAG: DUF58 domain-containing protein [Planctomycetaceae bacterium]|jgi:uncharacterized protein (DUF58 family)|nr:DUF58 domain-containing protein [Planctomycetaceae bacterium]
MKRNTNNIRTFFCREGTYYSLVIAGVLFIALLKQVNPMMLFASLLVCPLFIGLWLGRQTLKQLTVKRIAPSRIHAGDTFVTQLEVSNTGRKISSWGVVAEDTIKAIASGSEREQTEYKPAVYLDYIGASENQRKSYVGRLPVRGRYCFKKVTLSTRFPCGFFRSVTELEAESEMIVLPKLGTLTDGWITRQHEANETILHRRRRSSRMTGEFFGVREWRRGDTKRGIHWRSSARHNQMMVRQYEQYQNRDAAILLDLFHVGELLPRDEENMELAISFAATLTGDVIRRGGYNVTFGTFQDKYEIYRGASNAIFLERILERLAVVKRTQTDCLAELMTETLSNTDPNADLILITSLPIDLNGHGRLANLKNDPRLRTVMQRLRVVVTSDAEFDKIFVV